MRAVINMHAHHHHDHGHEHGEPDTAGHAHHHEPGDANAGGGGHAGGHVDDPATGGRLIRGSAPVDTAALADPDVPLESLVRPADTSRGVSVRVLVDA